MDRLDITFLILGILFLAFAGISAPKAPNISFLVGTFLPGILCLIVGLKLRQNKNSKRYSGITKADASTNSDLITSVEILEECNSRYESLKRNANFGVGCGILLMLLGSAVAQGTERMIIGTLISFAGCAWMIWGCVNYVIWKGYSGWFGLFGYLLLPGLVILACLPNKRKRNASAFALQESDETRRSNEDARRSRRRYFLALLPLAIIMILLYSLFFSVGANIESTEWTKVAPAEMGFQALLPGKPRLEQSTQETPAGKIETRKFSVMPKGKNEVFIIIVFQFPDEVSQRIGSMENLLELGKQDILAAAQGELKSERRIDLRGSQILELEVLPQKGAIIKSRIYATKNQLYEVSVHVPKIRLDSRDVLKFFDSFTLLNNPNGHM